MATVTGKIAAIITSTKLALNVGEKEGVRVGDIVVVFDAMTVDDPDGGPALGTVLNAKVRLAVTEVQPRLSVAVVTDTYRSGATRFRKTLTTTAVTGLVRSAASVHVAIGDTVEVSSPPEPSAQ